MQEPHWVLERTALAIHARQIAEHGGDSGIRDAGLLASALARPQNAWAYGDPKPDHAALAAAYAYGLAKNHPFVDGNKRVAYVASLSFLRVNDLDVEADAAEKYHMYLGLADGSVDEEMLADWLRNHLVSRSG